MSFSAGYYWQRKGGCGVFNKKKNGTIERAFFSLPLFACFRACKKKGGWGKEEEKGEKKPFLLGGGRDFRHGEG